MAADGNLLQGQVNEDPHAEKRNVEGLLQGLLKALLDEQGHTHRANANPLAQKQADAPRSRVSTG